MIPVICRRVMQHQYSFMNLKTYGQIGAGRVVPFTKPGKASLIVPVPTNVVQLEPMLFTVCGDSFIDEGVEDGAVMIARRKFDAWEITPGRLCIVRIAGIDDTMKRIYIEGDSVRLSASNSKYRDWIYPVDVVEVVALVVGEFTPRE